MRATCDRDHLAAAVAFAQRSLPKSSPHPALNGIRLTGGSKTLTVSAFDFDTYTEASCVARGEDVDILVPGHTFARYVAGMSHDTIDLAVDDMSVTITSGRSRVSLRQIALTDYPTVPEPPEVCGGLDAADLWAAIASVRDCIDPSIAVHEYTGASVVIGDELIIAGLNPFRMAVRTLDWQHDAGSHEVIVPLGALDAVKGMTGEVQVGCDGSNISLTDGDRLIITRLIAGQQPRFRQVFAGYSARIFVTLSRSELAEALKFVALGDTRKETLGHLFFDIGTDSVSVALTGVEALDASIDVDAKVEGDPLQVKLKAAYLLSGMNATDAETVTLGFTDGRKAIGMTCESDPSLQFLCMPVAGR